jgi:hypothetical protein
VWVEFLSISGLQLTKEGNMTWINWKNKEETVDEMPTIPRVAELPAVPDFSQADEEAMVASQAAAQVVRFKRERKEMQDKIDSHVNDAKKIGFLELENSQLRTEIKTLQSDLTNLKRYLSLQKQVYDQYNIQAPEKPKRIRKEKKAKPTAEAVNEQQ